MASRLNPYLTFGGNAREAMEFYQAALGGELTANTYGELAGGSPEGAPPGYEDKLMHSLLETPSGFTLMGADDPPGESSGGGSGFSISLSGDDADDLRGYWEKLSDGGTVTVPLEQQMWGDEFGMVVDRFGVNWMVNIVAPE
ncbi:VOC family protein [Nocardioides speluncae]|uniref:VOC family protein n=1 Tax=Nocardioides speluncae TaxID=2670337 RepID=UPI000D69CCF8|nr:VOC family protein [Nocardioides speluncae]